MESTGKSPMTRRGFVAAGATAFMIVPRHVLGGAGYTAPSDKVTIAWLGRGGRASRSRWKCWSRRTCRWWRFATATI